MSDIFLHIPKTGGSSLRTALRFVYGWRRVHTTPTGVIDPSRVARRLNLPLDPSPKLIRGHVTYGLHGYLDGSCCYFTMLRRPIPRVLSLYYYLQEGWPNAPVADLTLAEYIERDHHAYVPNDQTRRLAGPPYPDDPHDESLLQRAIDHLDHDIAFGLTERFDESLLLLRRMLEWPRLPLYIRVNTNRTRPSRSTLDSRVVERIEEQNQLDIRLYEYSREEFDARLDRQEGLSGDLVQYRTLNRVLETAGTPIMTIYQGIRTFLDSFLSTRT